MKKILCVLVVVLLLSGCTQTSSLPINGYDYSGNSYSTWFEVTDSDFIKTFNVKLEEAGYTKLVLRNPEETERLDYVEEGTDYPYLIEINIHKDGREIRSLQANFDLKGGADPQKAGFYYQTLIEMFTPRYSEETIDYLHIFEGIEDNLVGYEYTVGNTVFKHTRKALHISPIDYAEPTPLPVRP